MDQARRRAADSPELLAALTLTTYSFKGDRLILEPKEDIKAKLGYSPDEADAAALSFAHPVSVPDHRPRYYRPMEVEYDPFRELDEGRVSATPTITIRLLNPGDDLLFATAVLPPDAAEPHRSQPVSR